MGGSKVRGLGIAVALGVIANLILSTPAHAAASLTIQPVTWNVVGLDSNNVSVGPNFYNVGARVCNNGTATATNVTATFVWDTSNTYLNTTGPTSLSQSSLAVSACFDSYFNVVVTRNSSAYNNTRHYHIAATADGVASVQTPAGRELYIEHLVSQNRNAVAAITGPGGVGDPAPTTVYVGQTYTYKMFSSTATNGYEQLVSFLDFPAAIFKVLSVNQTYTAPTGGTNDKIYADACGWDNDPTSPTYRSCIGPEDYSGGKAGGTIVTTYSLMIVGAGSATIGGLIYDFSGSSYHYNSDYGVGINAVAITSQYQTTNLAVSASASPNPLALGGGNATYHFTVTDTTSVTAFGAHLSIPVPSGSTYVSATPSTGSCSQSAGTVTCDLGDIAGSGSVTVDLVVTPTQSGTLSATGTVSSTSPDSNASDNSATASVVVTPPAPTITSHPSDPTTDPDASLGFTDSEGGVTFQCRLSEQHAGGSPVVIGSAPDADPNSGKFMNVTRGLASLGGGRSQIEMQIPGTLSSFEIGIFDGNMGGKWDGASCGSSDQVSYTLYADASGVGATSTVVAQWDSTSMADDGWFTASVANDAQALSGSGNYVYNLVAAFETNLCSGEMNNFKVRAEGAAFLLENSSYGFIGYTPTDPSSNFQPSTYTGAWQMYLDVTGSATQIDFWNGDFDRADDTHDTNSPSLPSFAVSPPAVDEGALAGAPADNAAAGSPLLVAPAIRERVTGPGGIFTANDNDPSGNKEWERFRLATTSGPNPDAVVSSLPAGSYEWDIDGVDGRNTLFVHPTYDLSFQAPGGWAACSTPATYSGLVPGTYRFEVRAVDAFGKISSVTSFTWEVQ